MDTYKELLLKSIGREAYDKATKSFDILGDIAVIDAEPRYAKRFADALMQTNPRINTVLRKGGAVSGEYRTRKYYYVRGRRNFDALYKENNCTFNFDVRKVFFSPRLSFERERVASASKNGENVMVMFSGVGPFAVEIAKRHKNSEVVGIELNRRAHDYAVKNALLNKVSNFRPVNGDARRLAGIYASFADRIVMPLPMSSYSFLGAALKMARKRCVIHFYAFGGVDDPFTAQTKKVKAFLQRNGWKMRILAKRVVRTYSAREVEIVLDILASG